MSILSARELERYRRQITLPGFGKEAQEKLKASTVLVTGVGGLGGTVALYLAVAGVGKLILLRGGELRLDDLNRQVLMNDEGVGKPRVFQAKENLNRLNPDVEVEAICEYVTAENVDRLVQSVDAAASCAHNFDERYLLNAACILWGKPMVEAAMNSMEAYLTCVLPHKSPCLSCLFPEKPVWDRRGFGVLGAVSGTLACLTALEIIKLLGGFGEPLAGQMLNMDLMSLNFQKLRLYKEPECPVCGSQSPTDAKQATDLLKYLG